MKCYFDTQEKPCDKAVFIAVGTKKPHFKNAQFCASCKNKILEQGIFTEENFESIKEEEEEEREKDLNLKQLKKGTLITTLSHIPCIQIGVPYVFKGYLNGLIYIKRLGSSMVKATFALPETTLWTLWINPRDVGIVDDDETLEGEDI